MSKKIVYIFTPAYRLVCQDCGKELEMFWGPILPVEVIESATRKASLHICAQQLGPERI